MSSCYLGRQPFLLDTTMVGSVEPALARMLIEFGCEERGGAVLAEAASLPALARLAADRDAFRWRGEAFDVRAEFDGPVLSQIDRGALPAFGMLAEGVHLNALVALGSGLHLWVARRSATKALDPGKLDHLVAGGIGAGMTPLQTLLKEAAEEAGMPESLARQAVARGTLSYTVLRQEGLRRDRLHCYDLMLPETFRPEARDGEVESFALWPLQRVVERVRDGDDFKFNVVLVLNALFARMGIGS